MEKSFRKPLALFGLTLGIALAAPFAQAAGLFAGQEIDPQFKAKIMKEKVKQMTAANRNGRSATNAPAGAQCGSLNIGNVDTGGRVGAAPREVFVFAPNAINLVSGQGCN